MYISSSAEKVRACLFAKDAGADSVKNSTGFSSGGATPEDVSLIQRTVGDGVGVKASGGIRTREQARRLVASGDNRIGTRAGVRIVTEMDKLNNQTDHR